MCVSSPLAKIATEIDHARLLQPFKLSNTQQLLKYLSLEQKGKVMAEYVWIDAEGGVRSKTKVRVTPIITGGSLSRNLSQPRFPPDKPAHFSSTAMRSEPPDDFTRTRLDTN